MVSNLDSALTFLCMGSGWAASRASSDCSGNRRTAHCEVGHCHPSVARKSSMKACGSSCGSILVSMMWAGSVVVTGAAAGVPACWTILQSTCWSSAWVWRNAWKLLLLLRTQCSEGLVLCVVDAGEGLDDFSEGNGLHDQPVQDQPASSSDTQPYPYLHAHI